MVIKQIIYSFMAVVLVMIFSTQIAFADVMAVYNMTSRDGNGTQTIHYKDNKHVRLDMANNTMRHPITLIKLGDKVYVITGKVVQDMDQMAEMMSMMGKGVKNRQTERVPIKYEDTGKTEVIAGIKGKVYHFVERGKQHEIVFGDDENLQAATLGVIAMTKAVLGTGMMPDNAFSQIQQDSSIKNMALLRLDEVMRLQSMNSNPIQNTVFVLPEKPQDFGGAGIGGLLKGLMDK